ncbi:hypothetical protein PINS_up005734 [Pythium insidiosum]|nr:hypothetical protein PINS_up005734 [Pythium insidiosum]
MELSTIRHALDDARRRHRDDSLSRVPVFDDAGFRRGAYRDGEVLRFRGIIRDVHDPELVVLDDSGAMTDDLMQGSIKPDQFVERVPLSVALVPFVTEWARARYHSPKGDSSSSTATTAEPSQQATAARGTKRPNDSSVDDVDMNSASTDQASDDIGNQQKKVKADADKDVPSESGTATPKEQVVSIYVYDQPSASDGAAFSGGSQGLDGFKVNEAFEFVGVLDLSVAAPTKRTTTTSDNDASHPPIEALTISECLEDMSRRQQSSVVLHCCEVTPLDSLYAVRPNTTATNGATILASNDSRRSFLQSEWATLGQETTVAAMRASLLEYLATAVGGDRLCAEYVLLALLSRVYSRPDHATALGHLAVNLQQSETTKDGFLDRLRQVLSDLVPMLAPVDMSINALNTTALMPYKDYDRDALCGGALQLARGTLVLLDETALSAGQLRGEGVKNLGALQSVVEKMLLPYDFQYYSMDFPLDVAVLSVSHGKSILPVHASVPIDDTPSTASPPSITEGLVECFRLYLAVLRSLDVRLGNELADRAEKHYVECRKTRPNVSIEDLHRWLRLARLVALSCGEDEVSTASWEATLALEQQRLARLDAASSASTTPTTTNA